MNWGVFMELISAKVLDITKSKPTFNEHEITIILVLDGTLTLTKFNKTTTYHSGDVAFINSKTLYMMQGNHTIIELVTIHTSLFRKYHYDSMSNITLIDSLEENYPEKDIYYIYRDCIFIKDLLDAYTTLRSNNTNAVHILEEKLITSLINEYATTAVMDLSEEQSKRYYHTLNYIFDSYKGKLSLETIADEEGLRKTSFAQSYKQLANETFLETASKIRLRYAQHLLSNSELSNSEISLACGFSDMKYFYRDFQKVFHMTPSVYKKWINDYSQNFYIHELTKNQALSYIDIHNNELSYIKVDTRLYQQYLLLKELEFSKYDLENYEITIDLLNEMNYLIYNNNRYFTWYGLNLLLNLISKNKINATFRISIEEIHNNDEQAELLHLLHQTIQKLTKRQQKQFSFEITLHSTSEIEKAMHLQIALYQHHNIKASVTIL